MIYQNALCKAIRYFGSQSALARAIGVTHQAVNNWLNRENSIPYLQVLKIVEATNGVVSYHELAPQEKQVNKFLDDLVKADFTKVIKIPIDQVKENQQLCLHDENPENSTREIIHQEILRRPILVNENFQLIECNCQLNLRKKLGHQFIFVKIMRE